MKLKNFMLAAGFLCLVLTLNAKAQLNIPSTIQGRVMRGATRGIRFAQVTVMNLITLETQTHVTNDSGYFRFNDLPFGNVYYVTVKAKNFEFPYVYGSFALDVPVRDMTFVAYAK